MTLTSVVPQRDWMLSITLDDGRSGLVDIKPYLEYEVFSPLKSVAEFMKIVNGSYYVEWECGADLSADTLESKMV